MSNCTSRRLAARLIALSVFSGLLLAAQQTVQYGNATFQMPAGWTSAEQNGGLYLDAPESNGQVARIIIAPSQPVIGDFRTMFTTLIRAIESQQTVVKACDPRPSKSEAGFDLLVCASVLRSPVSGESYRLYIAGLSQNRFELMMYIAGTAELFQKYRPAFEGLLTTVTYSNKNSDRRATPTTGNNSNSSNAGSPGALPGFYVYNGSELQYNWGTNGYNTVVKQEYYSFRPDGTVYYGLPKGSLSDFHCEQMTPVDRKNCGTYQVNGAWIDIRWPNNPVWKPQHMALRVLPNAVVLGQQTFQRVRTEPGLLFEGRYGYTSYTAVNGGGGVSGEHSIEFSRDGRFVQRGSAGFTASTSNLNAATHNTTGGSGTYRVMDGALELSYSDGRKATASFFRFPGEEQKVICLDGTNYLRK